MPERNPLELLEPLAKQANVLILGEIHGTQEVPQLLGAWLGRLRGLGYGMLALELPKEERRHLTDWAIGQRTDLPPAFARPSGDGRANAQSGALVRRACHESWELACFDSHFGDSWIARDQRMAEILLTEWNRCPQTKVVAVCGNMHSRLRNEPDFGPELWPSFAAVLQQERPDMVVHSVNLVFHQGGSYNHQIHAFELESISEAYIGDGAVSGHTLELHLPYATPAPPDT